jgi:hypothetical protein
MRFDTHEAAFLGHAAGLLPDDIWIPCLRSLHADLATPEYVEVWRRAREFYAVSFATMVDTLLADAVHMAEEPGNATAAGLLRERPTDLSAELNVARTVLSDGAIAVDRIFSPTNEP